MGHKIDRRDFLALMGLGGAAAATMSCGDAPNYDETWHPWVEPVEGTIPYVPRYYATTCREAGGCGLWVKVNGGRATKVEGNPAHPINQGSLTAAQQSVVQGLYGAERLRKPRRKDGTELTWRQAKALLIEQLEKHQGGNVTALAANFTGAVHDFWVRFLGEMGTGKLVHFEPFTQSDFLQAGEKAFDRQGVPYVSLKGADYICSLGAQFLETWGEPTANARHYGEMKTPDHGQRGKHVQIEAKMTGTGANADEVLYAKPGSESLIALALLKELAPNAQALTAEEKAKIATLTANASIDQAALAAQLKADHLKHLVEELSHAQSAVVLPAERYVLGDDAVLHYTAVLLLNKALGGIGKHFNYDAAKPINHVPNHAEYARLIDDMSAGNVGLLFIKDANPVHVLPNSGFAQGLAKVGFSVAFADSINETVAQADLILPVTHDLESWGEINTYQGVDMLMQPVMRPRWEIKQAEDRLIEALAHFGKDAPASFRDFLKNSWTERFGADAVDKDGFWRESLKQGGRFQMAETGTDLPLSGNLADDLFSRVRDATVEGAALVIVESARLGDGGVANRGWLQELPDAMTGVTWDSWLEISPANARSARLQNGDVVNLQAAGQSVDIPVFICETTGDHAMTLATGMGHTGLDPLFNRGVNAFAFLTARPNADGVFTTGPLKATIKKTGRREKMATFHLPGKGDKINTPLSRKAPGNPHYDRDLYQTVALGAVDHAGDGHGGGGHGETINMDAKFPLHQNTDFYPDRKKDVVVVGRSEHFYQDYKWELGLDLNKCNGCGSCVTACYAENNLPVVGKDQVAKGREMAWIRINRYLYYAKNDGEEKVRAGFLPMMCQQCGNAPCESVCPSLATYHSKEGLNAMVYNRCVGTRYCANNCSYKVRRFNWFSWPFEGDLNWQLNPAVSVRQKGVMEKCTFCVQRIRDAKDKARDEGRKVRDGEVQTACQQACPAQAIQFGNYMDPNSAVHKLAHEKHAYRSLDNHLHTKPGVSYLKRVVLEEDHHG